MRKQAPKGNVTCSGSPSRKWWRQDSNPGCCRQNFKKCQQAASPRQPLCPPWAAHMSQGPWFLHHPKQSSLQSWELKGPLSNPHHAGAQRAPATPVKPSCPPWTQPEQGGRGQAVHPRSSGFFKDSGKAAKQCGGLGPAPKSSPGRQWGCWGRREATANQREALTQGL